MTSSAIMLLSVKVENGISWKKFPPHNQSSERQREKVREKTDSLI
jgi:hypothetical protein